MANRTKSQWLLHETDRKNKIGWFSYFLLILFCEATVHTTYIHHPYKIYLVGAGSVIVRVRFLINCQRSTTMWMLKAYKNIDICFPWKTFTLHIFIAHNCQMHTVIWSRDEWESTHTNLYDLLPPWSGFMSLRRRNHKNITMMKTADNSIIMSYGFKAVSSILIG